MDAGVEVCKDTTAKLIEEGNRRGHQVFFYEPSNLSLCRGEVVATVYAAEIRGQSMHLTNRLRLNLSEMDLLFIRQNPPFDMRYVTTTYILEKLGGVLIINNPSAIRNFPEKLLPLSFPEFIPPTLVSENSEEIGAFHGKYGDVVLKPLYSFGGDGVVKISCDGDACTISRAMVEKYGAPIVVQQFIPMIEEDRRVVLLGGKPVGAVKRRITAAHEVRTNLRIGAVPEEVALSERDEKICEAVGEVIAKAGIVFAGIDILGGYLLEVNITSPCGILEVNQVYGGNLEIDCWNAFERLLTSGG